MNRLRYYWVHLPYYRELLYYFKKLLIYRDVGAAQEMMYWKAELGPRGWTPIGKDIYHRMPEIEEAIKRAKMHFDVEGREMKVLEIGPGPRSGLAEWYDRGDYDLVGVDPLADDYRKEFNGGDFLVQGMGEDVGDMFPDDSFHMVYASNAIDHCVDPQKVITGVSVVLKRGGVFIICGNVREGTRSGWKGYHKNDLWVDGRRLMRCGRDGNESVLIGEGWEMLKMREMDYPWASEVVRWFYAEWRKR